MADEPPPKLENGAMYSLTIRCDRPIEGCELIPHAFLQIKGGNLDNLGKSKLLEASPFELVYRWSRGTPQKFCQNPRCPRGDSYLPVHWAKAVSNGPELLCLVCESGGVPSHECVFCSPTCYKDAWSTHSIKHKSLVFSKRKMSGEQRSRGGSHDLNFVAETILPEDTDPEAELTDAVSSIAIASVGGSKALSYTNGLVDESGDWTIISQDKAYSPSVADIGCRLRIEVSAITLKGRHLLAGPVAAHTAPVLLSPNAPPKRKLLTIPGSVTGLASAPRFRLISYNILAEQYATRQMYPYCDSWTLAWPYRKTIILKELEDLQGDLVCLQEVQADHYEEHLKPFMDKLGYDSLYKHKSRDCDGQYGKVDGCATFWKRNKFLMSENYSVEFNSIAFQEAMSLGLGETDCRKFMNKLSKDNIAQIVVLTSLQMSNDVKLWQSVSLMREIQMFLASRDYPLILCGDFNSEPDSAVHEFLLNGGIINSHDELQAENNKVQILPDLSELNHHIPFASAMSTAFGEEPLYTNYTANFKGTLDYIFYTPNSLRIMAAMAIPDERDVAIISGRGLPSACFASDHFALCCDIAVTGNGLSPSTSNGSPSLMGMNGNVYDTTFSLNGNSTGSGNSYSGQRVRSRTRR